MGDASMRNTGWLANLQRQFKAGKHTDMVIRVRVGDGLQPLPAAKRRRTTRGAAKGCTDIKAHSVVLCSQSAYFEKCMEGEWAEAAEECVEVTVPDEQAVEDLKLLIKLSYSHSYIHDEGELLPLETRLRLGVLADGFEFTAAVEQVVESLHLGLTFEAVQTCLNDLPPVMELLIGKAAVRGKLVEVLSKGIEELLGEENQGEEVNAAVALLAMHAGPVAAMFVVDSYGNANLRKDIRELPFRVFNRLWVSNELQLQSENETYLLLAHWVCESPHVYNRGTFFNVLAPQLRYHNMTPEFIAGIVAECHLMKGSGLLSVVLKAALGQRSAPPALLAMRNANRGLGDRGVPPSQARWELQATFKREDLAAFGPGAFFKINCGYVAGHQAALMVGRARDGDTFDAWVSICKGFCTGSLPGAPDAGLGFRVQLRFPAYDKELSRSVFYNLESEGFIDVFGQPWAEVVREGSPHFPGGKMEVRITVEPITAETGLREEEEEEEEDEEEQEDDEGEGDEEEEEEEGE